MPYPAAVFYSFSVNCWEFFFTASQQIDVVSKPHIAKWSSSDEHWWQWGVNFLCIFYYIICKAIVDADVSKPCIVVFRNILGSTGDNGHPCRIPTIVRRKSSTLSFSNTALLTSLYNDLTTSINRLSMLYSFTTHPRPSCQTRSNAFLKAMKLWKSSFWCSKSFSTNSLRLTISSVVLLCDLKLVCSSSKIRSAWFGINGYNAQCVLLTD